MGRGRGTGDVGLGTWDLGRGDVGTRGLGDSGTRGLGDSGTWGHIFTICLTFHHISQNLRLLIVTAFFPGLSNLVPRVSHLNAWGERGETLVGSGHMSPRIWEMTIYPMKGGAA